MWNTLLFAMTYKEQEHIQSDENKKPKEKKKKKRKKTFHTLENISPLIFFFPIKFVLQLSGREIEFQMIQNRLMKTEMLLKVLRSLLIISIYFYL